MRRDDAFSMPLTTSESISCPRRFLGLFFMSARIGRDSALVGWFANLTSVKTRRTIVTLGVNGVYSDGDHHPRSVTV